MAPPIKLENSFLVESSFTFKFQGFDQEKANLKYLRLGDDLVYAHAEGGPKKDQPKNWLCRLTVSTKVDAPDLPCTFKVIMAGIFTIADEFPGSAEQLIFVTGASMLYGSVREHILSVSSRGPYPALMIPTVAFSLKKKDGSSLAAEPVEPRPPATV